MLFTKMTRTVKLYKTQFTSMILMVFLGVSIFVGINSEWYGMKVEVEKYYNDTNLSDIWVYSDYFSNEDINKVMNSDKIKEAERRLTIDTTVSSTNKKLNLNFIEKNEISMLLLIEGEEFNVDNDGIWLYDVFANKNNYNIGDTINITYNSFEFEKEIKGFVKNPEYVYFTPDETSLMPNYQSNGYGFISYKYFPLDNIVFNKLLIKTQDLENDEIGSHIRDLLIDKALLIINRDMHPSVNMFEEEINSNKVMGGLFPIVFLLIAILTMITTMARITKNERVQIGILKALGFSNGKILWHYTSYGLLVGLVGSIFGVLIGPLFLGKIFVDFQKTMYDLPIWKTHVALINYILVIFMLTVLILVSFLSCKRALSGSASQSLKPEPPKHSSTNIFENTKIWSKMSFNLKWNIRDIFRNKIRSLMTIFGVGGCTMLLVCAFALNDSIEGINSRMYQDLHKYQNKINITETSTEEDLNRLILEVDGETVSNNIIEIYNKETAETKALDIYNVQELIKFEDINQKQILISKEGLYITYKLSESLNISEGDLIKWRLFGYQHYYESKVVGIISTPVGQGFLINSNYAERLGLTYKITSVYTNMSSINFNSNSIQSIQSKNDLIESLNTMLETTKVIIFIMISGAVILGLVVLYNLGILSYTERFRELSTLKVIGFQNKQINKLLISQNIWLTIVGLIIGIPLGKILINTIMGMMPDNLDIIIVIKLLSFIYCVVGTLLVSIFVNTLLFRKTKHIDMVSSLKISE